MERACGKAAKHNILNDRVANALLASLFKSISLFFIVIKYAKVNICMHRCMGVYPPLSSTKVEGIGEFDGYILVFVCLKIGY